MYSIIFDDNFIKEAHEATIVREARQKGRDEGISIGEARGESKGISIGEARAAARIAELEAQLAQLSLGK